MRTRISVATALLALAGLVFACAAGDATGEYARRLCAPYERFTTAISAAPGGSEDGGGHADEESPGGTANEDSENPLGQFDRLVAPLSRLAQDLEAVDPPGGLRDYHDALVARTDYTARAVAEIVEHGPFGVFGLGVTSEPAKAEAPRGLSEAVLAECGETVAVYFGDEDILDMVGENAEEVDDHHSRRDASARPSGQKSSASNGLASAGGAGMLTGSL